MSAIVLPGSKAGQKSSPAYLRILGNPWLDRTIAIIASIPFINYGYRRYRPTVVQEARHG